MVLLSFQHTEKNIKMLYTMIDNVFFMATTINYGAMDRSYLHNIIN